MSEPKLPPLPPGATLDDLPPLPPGARLDDVEQRVSTAQQLLPSRSGVTPLPGGSTSTFGSASKSGAALRGFGQGASFGFADELEGAVKGVALGTQRELVELAKTPVGRALVRKLTGQADMPDAALDAMVEASFQRTAPEIYDVKGGVPLDPDAALEKGYRAGRDEARLGLVQSQKSHPYTYGGSQLAGAIAAPGPAPAKGMSGLAKAGFVAKVGAGMGAAGALGSSNVDLTRLDERPDAKMEALGDVALGSATGGVLAPVASVVGDKLGPVVKRWSQDNALKAIGVRAGISNQLASRGYETADEARQLGQAALDMELVRRFRTAQDVAERAGFAKEVQGARIEQALADADATGVPFDLQRASWDATSRVMGPSGLTAEAMSKARPAAGIVDRILKQADVDSSFAAANRLKSDIYEGINYGTEPALSTKLQRRAASGLRSSIEDQMEEAAGLEAADQLRAANKAYGYLSDIMPLAQDEATRQLGRAPWYSPGNLAAAATAGAGGTFVGGMPGAAAGIVPLLGRAMQPRVASTLAVAQRALAPNTSSVLGALAKPAIQAPMRPSLEEQEEDAIQAFLSGG